MILDLYMTWATVQVLRKDKKTFSKTLDSFHQLAKGYSLDEAQKAGAFSIASQDLSGGFESYISWISRLHEMNLVSANIFRPQSTASSSALPAHIAASFSNGAPFVLSLEFETGAMSYVPVTLNARSTFISGTELMRFIDQLVLDSPQRDRLWNELLEKDVKRFGDYMNAHSIEDARRFLELDFENYFCPADDLLRTAQYFCAQNGLPFKITSEFEKFFRKEEGGLFDSFGFTPYTTTPLTKVEWVNWIDSRANSSEIWVNILNQIQYFLDDNDRKKFPTGMSAPDVRNAFLGLSEEVVSSFPSGPFLSCMGLDIEIPDHLKSKFVFPEKPPVSDSDLWVAVPNPTPWSMLCYRCVDKGASRKLESLGAPSLNELIQSFQRSLGQIQSFADRVKSGFSEAFRLSLWLLNENQTTDINDDDLMSKVVEAGFSERAQEVLSRNSSLGLAKALELPRLHRRLGLAIEMSTVFGGMGSWNDQGFENQKDQAEFESVSASLFESMQAVQFALVVSSG
jgi:hypothetical protein